MHFHWGADSYGRVKVVGRTAIVTRFFAVDSLPIYPLQSFYLWICADPARVAADFGLAMAEFASGASRPNDRDDSRGNVLSQLVDVRARIGLGDGDVRALEQETNRLLARLDQLDRQLA